MAFLDFYRSRDGRRVLLYQAMALAASAIALSLSLGDGHLDLTIARGAHFVSHVLWSAWIVWAVNLALLGCVAVLSGATAQEEESGPLDEGPAIP